MPDLRRISAATYSNFYNIVLRGAYLPLGMAPFDDLLSEREASQIRAYLVDESWKAYTSNGSHPINQGH